ncbi:MAG: type II secretion system F family protein [Candidatus Dormibacteria bacterium]
MELTPLVGFTLGHLSLSPAGAPVAIAGAAAVGAAAGTAVWLWPARPSWGGWMSHRTSRRRTAAPTHPDRGRHLIGRAVTAGEVVAGRLLPDSLRSSLLSLLQRGGLELAPERAVSEQLLLMLALAVLLTIPTAAGLVPVWLAVVPVLLLPPATVLGLLRSARNRRRAALAQLPILVDLMALEQSGGGVGTRRAMELVVARVRGVAAAILRDCLTRSAASGTLPLDRQLEDKAERMQLPALAAMAAVIRLQRDEGISTASPLGNLARGLRDRQRDELTARGRRALVSMLLPVALCILLPFIMIILYPALERLAGAFQ